MNRFATIDSNDLLDAIVSMGDSCQMIVQRYQLYIERMDRSQNMARFYALSIEPTLFGEICLRRRWGRIGASGQSMQHSFANERDAVALFLDLLREKRRRGYRPKARSMVSIQHETEWIDCPQGWQAGSTWVTPKPKAV